MFATYCLNMIIICAKLFFNPSMYSLVMARTRFWHTHTYTHGHSKVYMPFRRFIWHSTTLIYVTFLLFECVWYTNPSNAVMSRTSVIAPRKRMAVGMRAARRGCLSFVSPIPSHRCDLCQMRSCLRICVLCQIYIIYLAINTN